MYEEKQLRAVVVGVAVVGCNDRDRHLHDDGWHPRQHDASSMTTTRMDMADMGKMMTMGSEEGGKNDGSCRRGLVERWD